MESGGGEINAVQNAGGKNVPITKIWESIGPCFIYSTGEERKQIYPGHLCPLLHNSEVESSNHSSSNVCSYLIWPILYKNVQNYDTMLGY